MTVEIKKEDEGVSAAAPPTAPAQTGLNPPGQAKPDAVPTPALVAPTAKPATPAPEAGPKRARLADEGDDIPADAELLEMSQKALKSRLDRHSKKSLRDRFGTDDPDAIQAKLDKLDAMEKAEESKRLAEMTENDRLKEQLATEQKARAAAEQRYSDMRERQVLEQEDRRVLGIAEKFIKPKFIKRWIPDLAAHIAGLDEEDLRNPEQVIESWCRAQAEENPEISVASPPPAPPAPPVPPPRVPITTGPEATKPTVTPSGAALSKTAAPNQPNSMSDSEWKKYKRDNGISY